MILQKWCEDVTNSIWLFLRRTLFYPVVFNSLVIIGALLFGQSRVSAYLYGPKSVTSLASAANLIIKGRVTTVASPIQGQIESHIQVEQVLKGNFKEKELELIYSAPMVMGPILDNLTPGEYALFFLKFSDTGIIPSDPMDIKMPIRQGRSMSTTDPANPIELVREELLFTASGPTILSKEDAALQELYRKQNSHESWAAPGGRIIRDGYFPSLNAAAILQLGYLPAEARTLTLLRSLLATPDYHLRGDTITALLNLHQTDALRPAIAYINFSSNHTSVKEQPVGLPGALMPGFSVEVATMLRAISSVTDVKSVDDLGVLIKHQDVWVRRAAAQALRNTYGNGNVVNVDHPLKSLSEGKSIPFLAQALDDTDPEVQFQAMAGLAEVTQKRGWYPPYFPAQKEFNPATEQKFLAHWKQWWQTIGKPAFAGQKT